jgi:hypothetical protein
LNGKKISYFPTIQADDSHLGVLPAIAGFLNTHMLNKPQAPSAIKNRKNKKTLIYVRILMRSL